jgi:hypothetical protein
MVESDRKLLYDNRTPFGGPIVPLEKSRAAVRDFNVSKSVILSNGSSYTPYRQLCVGLATGVEAKGPLVRRRTNRRSGAMTQMPAAPAALSSVSSLEATSLPPLVMICLTSSATVRPVEAAA